MSATATELRRLSEAAITAILNTARRCLLGLPLENISTNNSPVSCVALRSPTGTITITISHWRSDGSADDAILSITPQNSDHGEKGFAPSTDSRFMYCAKASRADRDAGLDDTFEKKPLNWSSGEQNPGSFQSEGTDKTARNNHPTVKPTELMAYLCRLVTPPDGLVLDPFMGSGSTGRGAVLEGMRFIGCELSPDYLKIAAARIAAAEREVVDEARRAAEATRQADMFAPAAPAPTALPKAPPQIDMFAAS